MSLIFTFRYSRSLVNRLANLAVLKSVSSVTLKSVFVNNIRPSSSTSVLDVNTNVVKDVLLYSHDAKTAFNTLKNIPVVEPNPDGPWYTKFNFGSDKARYILTGLCLILGNGFLAVSYFYTVRSVKFIVLRKGGQNVSIITYSPIGKDRIATVPISQVSANESRATARLTIPLKVKGKSLFYLMDMKGKFGNAKLFDATVGLRRTLTN